LSHASSAPHSARVKKNEKNSASFSQVISGLTIRKGFQADPRDAHPDVRKGFQAGLRRNAIRRRIRRTYPSIVQPPREQPRFSVAVNWDIHSYIRSKVYSRKNSWNGEGTTEKVDENLISGRFLYSLAVFQLPERLHYKQVTNTYLRFIFSC
jgi:hypothetical protein